MPKTFSLAVKREWLKDWERGETEVAIATRVKCDARTIKKGIEEARRDRDGALARAELVKDALVKHQDMLKGVLEQISSAVVVPALRFRDRTGMAEVVMPDGMGESGITIMLPGEDRPEWSLLQEHLRRDRLWKVVAEWRKRLKAHVIAKTAIETMAIRLLREKTGLEVLNNSPKAVEFIYGSTPQLLCELILAGESLLPSGDTFDSMLRVDKPSGEVRWGQGQALARLPGRERECRQAILNVLRELERDAGMDTVRKTHQALEAVSAAVRRNVDEIRLLGLVLGECRICRRLGG